MASSRKENEETTVGIGIGQATTVSLTVHSTAQTTDLEKIQLLLKYLDQKILKDETTAREYTADFFGLFFGGIGSYTAFPLGGGFGLTLGNAVNANTEALHFLYGFFGVIAYLPTMTLVTLANQAGLRGLASPFAEEALLFKKRDRKKNRAAATFLKYFFSPFTGIPFMSLTTSYVAGDLGISLAVITGLSCVASALAAQSRLIDKFFLHYETDEVKALRARLNKTVNIAQQRIKSLNESALDAFYQLLLDNLNSNANNSNLHILSKIKNILSLPAEPRSHADPLTATNLVLHPWVEKALNGVSVALGTTAIYTLHTATGIAADWFSNQAGIDDSDTRERIKTTATVLALIPNALFSFSYIEQKIHKTCLDWLSKNYCPSKKELLAAVISSASSTPNTFLAIETASTALQFALIAPAFLGPMFARTVAFGILIDKGLLKFNNIFYKNSTATKRSNLLNMTEKLRQTFFSVDPVYLYELEAALAESNSSNREEKAENPVTASPSHVTFHGAFFQAETPALELQSYSENRKKDCSITPLP